MRATSLFNAKPHLSGLVASLVDGKESEVQILRHGKPVARLTPVLPVDAARRIGCAKGKFRVPPGIDRDNPAILKMTHDETVARYGDTIVRV